MVTELNDSSFKKAVMAKVPVIVDFWASWCGPCRMMAPVFEELSNRYKNTELTFAKISTEDYPDIASESGISGIPCLIIFRDGKELDRVVGYAQADALKSKIDAILKKA